MADSKVKVVPLTIAEIYERGILQLDIQRLTRLRALCDTRITELLQTMALGRQNKRLPHSEQPTNTTTNNQTNGDNSI